MFEYFRWKFSGSWAFGIEGLSNFCMSQYTLVVQSRTWFRLQNRLFRSKHTFIPLLFPNICFNSQVMKTRLQYCVNITGASSNSTFKSTRYSGIKFSSKKQQNLTKSLTPQVRLQFHPSKSRKSAFSDQTPRVWGGCTKLADPRLYVI